MLVSTLRSQATSDAALENNLRGHRDRSMLTLGWFGAFRRSELVRIQLADVAFTREGLVVSLRKSRFVGVTTYSFP